ncbi:MAG: hypothetical protein K2G58_05865 [Alistipes sp.]|nr:hypothetical protein [Alistipes sp.]
MITYSFLSKKVYILCFLAMLGSFSFVHAEGRGERERIVRRPFSNFAVGVNAGMTGFGISVATPLCNYVSLRAGFATAPFSYKFVYDDFDFNDILPNDFNLPTSVVDRLNAVELNLKGELKMTSGHLLLDFVPFRRGNSSFFITAGLYFGNGKLVTVSGRFDDRTMADLKNCGVDITKIPVEIGDVKVMTNADGSVSADLKVRSIKPYVGLGFGRPIPRGRVGFRFELGALFHGRPRVVSDNLLEKNFDELNDVNKFLKNFNVYPQLNFQMTGRLLKDKSRR